MIILLVEAIFGVIILFLIYEILIIVKDTHARIDELFEKVNEIKKNQIRKK